MTRSISRRGLIKGIGATAAGGYALGSDHGVAQRGEAIAPVIVGAAVGGAVLAAYLRENDVLTASSPDDGLTPSALEQDLYETARTRKSTNASTIIDNRNIINTGFENALYTDGKVAAIEALNAEKSQSEVETAAIDAMSKRATTVERNLLKSWNESVRELFNLFQRVWDHSDVDVAMVIKYGIDIYGNGPTESASSINTNEVTLADGSTFDVETPALHDQNGHGHTYNPIEIVEQTSGVETMEFVGVRFSPPGVDASELDKWETYLMFEDWNGIWSNLQNSISNVKTGLQNWTSNVYSDVQAGSINISELITPSERAEMMAEDGAAAQAIADLAALNIPIASGTEYTISQSSTGATLRGRLALTDDSQTIEVGSTYNPSADTFSGDAYFVYDVAEGSGTWSAYEEGIDGGTITITKEPYENTTFSFDTSKNETVTVDHGNFTPTDGNGTEVSPGDATAWEADVSDRLENDIANIDSVNFFASSSESRIETIKLRSEFTVKEIVDAETGESKDTVEFQSAEPQDDQNYITQEEWEELEEKNQELIDKYEQSQQSSGSGIDLGQFGFGNVPGVAVVGTAGVLGAGFLAALFK